LDVGEALRRYHPILWVSDRQLDKMNFGLDLKEVVDYFKQGNNHITWFGRIVYGCKQNCNLFFQNSHVECS